MKHRILFVLFIASGIFESSTHVTSKADEVRDIDNVNTALDQNVHAPNRFDVGRSDQKFGPSSKIDKQRVSFKSGDLSLFGVLFKPEGPGPFPAIVWNHGSEKGPGVGPFFDALATAFVPKGYVVFAPVRRGHGKSPGPYIVETIDAMRAAAGEDAANRLTVHLLESEQLDDQLAALRYLKQQPFVDLNRIAVMGCSYGGIETLLGAERDVGYRGAISISPAALSWRGNSYLRERLVESIRAIKIPVLILQPAKDASLEPSRVLGAEAERAHKPVTSKVYPATGPEAEQGHCFGGAQGMHVWTPEAHSFLTRVLH